MDNYPTFLTSFTLYEMVNEESIPYEANKQKAIYAESWTKFMELGSENI